MHIYIRNVKSFMKGYKIISSSFSMLNRRIQLNIKRFSNYPYTSQLRNGPHAPPRKTLGTLDKILTKSSWAKRLQFYPWFQRYTDEVRTTGAGYSMVAFLILHELTAIVPVLGLWWMIYESHWLSKSQNLSPTISRWLEPCTTFIEKTTKRYGGTETQVDSVEKQKRVVLTGAVAYGIVKILYPVRLAFSLWSAPYCGRWIMKVLKLGLKKS